MLRPAAADAAQANSHGVATRGRGEARGGPLGAGREDHPGDRRQPDKANLARLRPGRPGGPGVVHLAEVLLLEWGDPVVGPDRPGLRQHNGYPRGVGNRDESRRPGRPPEAPPSAPGRSRPDRPDREHDELAGDRKQRVVVGVGERGRGRRERGEPPGRGACHQSQQEPGAQPREAEAQAVHSRRSARGELPGVQGCECSGDQSRAIGARSAGSPTRPGVARGPGHGESREDRRDAE